jgi:C4-dicarboxylate-specific signal transduction histidine kinase
MAAGITHEINTPLTFIKGNFEMLIEDLHTLPQSKLKTTMLEDTTTIQDGLERIGKIIESMREVSQKHTEKIEKIEIFSTILSSLTISYNRAKQVVQMKLNGKNFDINYINTEKKITSLVQKQRIEQVWIIIINNALDELIKIEDFSQREFNINIFKKQKNVIIQFKDNAGGIDEKILPNIFKPFESTKESSGIGIGLNIAQKIIEDQGGKIRAYNEDKGAVFEVILPAEKG